MTLATALLPDAGPVLVALDIDGTIVPDGTNDVPPITADAVQDVIAAGHHVVLATGRSLVGALPVAASLGMTTGWLVASAGAVTASLSPTAPSGYEVDDVVMLDVRRVVTLVREFSVRVNIAAEDVGVGYRVLRPFPRGSLPGRQAVVGHDGLPTGAPRMVLRGRGVGRALAQQVRALGLTATPASNDWLDVTPGMVSKGAALWRVRRRLDVHPANTVAIGNGINDLPAFEWAAVAVAMGDAPAAVRAAANATTGTLAQRGAATVLEAIAARRSRCVVPPDPAADRPR